MHRFRLIPTFLFVAAGFIWAAAELQASTPDTLTLDGYRIVNNLEEARSMQFLAPERVMITESGANRLVELQLSFHETERENAFQPDSESVISPVSIAVRDSFPTDIEEPGALSSIMDTWFAVMGSSSGQIHILHEQKEYIRNLNAPSWVLNGVPWNPKDIASNEIGELFVLDSHTKRVYHFNSNGSYLQYLDISMMAQPEALEHAEESLFISDMGTGIIYILTESGQKLAAIGGFPELSRVRVSERLIWVLSGSVIHLFDIYGEHVGNWRLPDTSETIRDMVLFKEHLFILTTGSLYYSHFTQQQH